MATDPATIEFLIDQLGRRGASYTTKRMFGEYCLYREGLPVAFVCDDVLFVKDTPAGRAAIETQTALEFGPPYPGAKLYLRLAPDAWDDGNWLRRVLDDTASALPAAKPKKAPATASTAAKPRAVTAKKAKRGASGDGRNPATKTPAPSSKRATPKRPGTKG